MHKTALLVGLSLFIFVGDAHAAKNAKYAKPIYLSFAADRTVVAPGESVTLSWASSNARRCYASGGWRGKRAKSGSRRIKNITQSKKYALKCKRRGKRVTRYVTVKV